MTARIRIAAAVLAVATVAFAVLAWSGGASGADAARAPQAYSPAEAPRRIENVAVQNGDLSLNALLARPPARKRFPAVVLLHGCSGLWRPGDPSRPQRSIKRWLTQLQASGYVGIAVDSFSARGVRSGCGRVPARVSDAFAALSYLRSLSYVSPQRIAVLGWASGGTAALASVGAKPPLAPPAAGGFKAAVAFYPDCRTLRSYRPAVATRVLAAAKDPLAAGCRTRARRAGKRFKLTVYRGARHAFDEISFHSAFDRAARKRGNFAAMATLSQALASQVETRTIFDPDSWVAAPLTASAPLDPDQSLASAFRQQIAQFGTWVNTTEWSAPVYVVPADQPRVKVHVDYNRSRYDARDDDHMQADFESVPLPPDAEASGPPESPTSGWVDHELIVYQPATDTAWEFYHLVKDSKGQFWATGGGKISGLSRSNGEYDPWPSGTPHGVTGAATPMLAGLQRVDELRRGVIDHVVGVSIPHPQKDVFRWPATRTDGEWTTPDAVPEGTRFRLPADLNVDALPLTPYAKIVAKAIQAHGLIVVDRDCRPTDGKRCPAVTFKAEDPRPRNSDPYALIFGGVPRDHLFDNFPWDKLQVLSQD